MRLIVSGLIMMLLGMIGLVWVLFETVMVVEAVMAARNSGQPADLAGGIEGVCMLPLIAIATFLGGFVLVIIGLVSKDRVGRAFPVEVKPTSEVKG